MSIRKPYELSEISNVFDTAKVLSEIITININTAAWHEKEK